MAANRRDSTVPTMLKGGLFASLVVLLAACSGEAVAADPNNSSAPNGIVAGTLEVRIADSVLTLRNTTEQQVSYLIVDNRSFLAVVPLCGAANCANLPRGASASVSYSHIFGYTSQSTEALLYWSRYTVRSDGTRVPTGAEQLTIIKLK